MSTIRARAGDGRASSTKPHEPRGELSGVLEILDRVSATLDVMWRTAVGDGSETAVRLGEASHGVHRAIIALSVPIDDRRPERWERPAMAG
jgi:hypothetical protein